MSCVSRACPQCGFIDKLPVDIFHETFIDKINSRLRILIVDDNCLNLKILGRYLEKKQGQVVFSASDGNKAWEMFNSYSLDLIILDIELPLISGIEIAKKIRQIEFQKKLPRIKIIGLSGFSEKNYAQKAIEAQMDLFLTKPYIFKDISRAVNACFPHTTAQM